MRLDWPGSFGPQVDVQGALSENSEVNCSLSAFGSCPPTMLNTYHIEIVPPAPETLTLLLQVPRNRGAVNDCCCG